jgi:hypothetical protein
MPSLPGGRYRSCHLYRRASSPPQRLAGGSVRWPPKQTLHGLPIYAAAQGTPWPDNVTKMAPAKQSTSYLNASPKADHSSLPDAEIKNEWSYTSTPNTYTWRRTC